MPEIKTREKVEKTIKTLDKGKVFREKVRKPNIKEADASVDLTSKLTDNDPKARDSHAPGGDKGDEKEDDSSVVSYADSKLKSGQKKGSADQKGGKSCSEGSSRNCQACCSGNKGYCQSVDPCNERLNHLPCGRRMDCGFDHRSDLPDWNDRGFMLWHLLWR